MGGKNYALYKIEQGKYARPMRAASRSRSCCEACPRFRRACEGIDACAEHEETESVQSTETF